MTLPGEDLVTAGVADLAAERVTTAALPVSLAATQLRELGVDVVGAIEDADHRLWQLLATDDPTTAGFVNLIWPGTVGITV